MDFGVRDAIRETTKIWVCKYCEHDYTTINHVHNKSENVLKTNMTQKVPK